MNRTIVGTLSLCLVLATVTFLGGCGDDRNDVRARDAQSRLEPTRATEAMTPEERSELDARRVELMTSLLVWPEGKDEPRDWAADIAACRVALESRRDIATANPLVQMTWSTRCMAEKGWVLDPDAEIPDR